MADQVEEILDRMVPALRDLLDRGIFSESEIHSIVSRRREYEYLIRRRACRKSDFSQYIEAEINLETLRRLRNKKLLASVARKEEQKITRGRQREDHDDNSKKRTNKRPSKSHIGDASIVQHIHYLYTRAKRKWKGDLQWHLQHVDFAKNAKSFRMLSKIYAEALQIHPRCVHLWIEAASHEYFGYIVDPNTPGMSGGGSIQSARVLLQRGLRINPSSEDLWLQYFSLEFHYIQKIRGRKQILQLGSKDGLGQHDNQKMDKDLTNEEEEDEINKDESWMEHSLLPRVVYKNAIKAIPKSVSFRLKFLDLCLQFPHTLSVQDEIMLSIERDFSQNIDAWIARAQYVLDRIDREPSKVKAQNVAADMEQNEKFLENEDDVKDGSQKRKFQDESDVKPMSEITQKLTKLFQDATDSLNSSDMYVRAIQFLLKEFSNHSGTGEFSDPNFVLSVDALFRKADENRICSASLLIERAEWLMTLGQASEIQSLFESALQSNMSVRSDPQLWLTWADIAERLSYAMLNSGKDILTLPEDILRKALDNIPMHEPGHFDIASRLLLILLSNMSSVGVQTESSYSTRRSQEAMILFDKLLILSSQTGPDPCVQNSVFLKMVQLCVCYLQQALMIGETAQVRAVYSRILFTSNILKPITLGEDYDTAIVEFLFDAPLSFESSLPINQPSSERAGGTHSKRILDAAIAFFKDKGRYELARRYMEKRSLV